jgi:hypothetical protein
MTIEIVEFPINSMVMFHSYVNVYQRVMGVTPKKKCRKPRKTLGKMEKMLVFSNKDVLKRSWDC